MWRGKKNWFFEKFNKIDRCLGRLKRWKENSNK